MLETTKERFFSIELSSKANLKNVTLANGGVHENVLIEGNLGFLKQATFIDGVVLEIVCDEGIFRINLTRDEIKQEEKKEREAVTQ